jgi:outer membrane protein assembly factor BamB
MKNVRIVFVLSLVVIGLVAAAELVAGDWAQWRGPRRTGVSVETDLAKAWPATGPRLVWQVNDIGDGYGSPAVAGGRLYIMGNDGLENEFVQAVDLTNGARIWRQRIGKVGNPDQEPPYPAARSTPTIDGELLYAFGSDGDLACLETRTGRVVWQKNVRSEFGGRPGDWAYAESPLVDGNVVVCSPGGSEAAIVALNKRNGELVWKSAVPSPVDEPEDAGYASAVVVEIDGKKQYVQFLGKGVVGVDAATGKFLWRYDATGGGPANIATPVNHDRYIYTAAGSGSGLVRLSASGDRVVAEQVYLKRGLPNAIGGSIVIDGHLYGTTRQGLICADIVSGEIKWENPSIGVGSVCSADGLLFIHGENGQLALVEATPVEYREKGHFALPGVPERINPRETAWSYPVVSNGRLYVRDKSVLWCYDVKEATSPE